MFTWHWVFTENDLVKKTKHLKPGFLETIVLLGLNMSMSGNCHFYNEVLVDRHIHIFFWKMRCTWQKTHRVVCSVYTKWYHLIISQCLVCIKDKSGHVIVYIAYIVDIHLNHILLWFNLPPLWPTQSPDQINLLRLKMNAYISVYGNCIYWTRYFKGEAYLNCKLGKWLDFRFGCRPFNPGHIRFALCLISKYFTVRCHILP